MVRTVHLSGTSVGRSTNHNKLENHCTRFEKPDSKYYIVGINVEGNYEKVHCQRLHFV